MNNASEGKSRGEKGKFLRLWGWLGTFAAGLVIFYLMVPMFVFMPSAALVHTPAAAGLSFEDVTLTTPDGVALHGWWIPAPNARAVLLFFHGNAGNISHRLDSIKIFHDLGISVFIFDYRGYGQSEGRPSIKGTGIDALAAWKWLTEDKKIPAGKIVVFGRSLGAAVAVELTRSVSPGALILESAFSSLGDMAPFFLSPVVRLVTRDAWNSTRVAESITVPTLCVHSPEDEMISYRQGRRLYDALAGEKMFTDIRGGHNEGIFLSSQIYSPALDKFLTPYFGKRLTGYTTEKEKSD